MADTATTSLRARKQSLASNQNIWGDPYLNTNLDIFDAGTTKFQTLTCTGGSYVLSSTDYDASAESIAAGLYLTGALTGNLAVVAPSRRKITNIRNATTGNFSVTWGVAGGVQVTIPANARGLVYTDGTDAFQLSPWYTTSGRITSLTDPSALDDAANKRYVDSMLGNSISTFSNGLVVYTQSGVPAADWNNFTYSAVSKTLYTSNLTLSGSLNVSGGFNVNPSTSGNLNNVTIGATTPQAGVFTTVKAATTVGVGNATPATSGAGVTFPAAQLASTDANTLDDYEEGTCTFAFTCGVPGDLSVAYSVQIGNYTKVGRLMHAQFSITTSAFTWSTSTGNCRLDALPFNTATQASNENVGTLWGSGITKANYTSYSCRAGSNSGSILFGVSGSGVARTSLAIGDFPSGGTVTLSGVLVYHTA